MTPQGMRANEHSPTPWRVDNINQTYHVEAADGSFVALFVSEADAAFIVEAVNERARLRKAFEDISEFAAAMTSEEDEANAFAILDICAKALEGM